MDRTLEELRIVYEDHSKALFNLAFQMTRSSADADDVLQDIFMRYFMALKRGERIDNPKAWLTKSVLRRAIDVLRQRKSDQAKASNAGASARGPAVPLDDLAEKILNAIHDLPLDQRTVIVLHDLQGYSHAEIAQLTGATPEKARLDLFRARKRLRERFKTRFVQEIL